MGKSLVSAYIQTGHHFPGGPKQKAASCRSRYPSGWTAGDPQVRIVTQTRRCLRWEMATGKPVICHFRNKCHMASPQNVQTAVQQYHSSTVCLWPTSAARTGRHTRYFPKWWWSSSERRTHRYGRLTICATTGDWVSLISVTGSFLRSFWVQYMTPLDSDHGDLSRPPPCRRSGMDPI